MSLYEMAKDYGRRPTELLGVDPNTYLGYGIDRTVMLIGRTILNEFDRRDSKHFKIHDSVLSATRQVFPLQMFLLENPGKTVEDYYVHRLASGELTLQLLLRTFGDIIDVEE